METLRGVVPVKLNNKSDFVFQAIEWVAEDVEVEDDDDEDSDVDGYNEVYKPGKDGQYTVRVYGMTEKSESVALKIVDFTPYFYVKVPYEVQSTFNNKHLKLLEMHMKERVPARFRESLMQSELLLRKEFYGFTDNELVKFLRFRFQSLSALRVYSRLFFEKIRISSIFAKELNYPLYESNIDPILRLCHIRDVKPVGWIKLPAGKYSVVKSVLKETKCQCEFKIDWNLVEPAINPNIGPVIVASFDIEVCSMDGSFPKAEREGDRIIQIGTTCHYHGQKDCFLKHIITLGHSNPIDGVVVECYETESEVLLAWTRFMNNLDPDIVTGYNIWGFDLKYMYERAVRLDIVEEFSQLGRIKGKTGKLIEKTLQSSALGQNFFYILEMEGRVQVDIMKVVQRDYKLDMYKLDFVAETFLKSNKVDLGPKELFAKFKAGGSENIRDIAVYCVQDCELCNRLMNKLEIITNNVGMGNVCHVPFYWLFLRGQGVKIYSLVARQCRLEGFLLRVQSKGADEDKGYEGAVVLVATPGIYMVPVSVNDFASLYPSSMISENISHDSIVFYKVMDNSENIINMQFGKPGWYSMFKFRDYDKNGILDEEIKKLGYKTNYIESVNYEGYYGDLTKKADEDDYECDVTESGKKILGKTICCYVEKDLPDGKEEKSVIPRILENLLWERRVTRASAFYEEFHMKDGSIIDGNLAGPKEDEEFYYVAEYKQKPKKVLKADVVERKEKYNKFQQSVLDGLQLAYKVTANSLYGQVGAPTSPIYFKELASSTTATGRKMLKTAKEMTEQHFPGARCVYGDSVTGDTPLILRDPVTGRVTIRTIESLSDEWIPYDEFKAGETNRREKQQSSCDLEIWVTDHWAKIHRVIRHKTYKNIHRISTLLGVVDVTEDHSLLDIRGEKIKPKNCKVDETELLHGFPKDFPEIITECAGDRIDDDLLNCSLETRINFVDKFFTKMMGFGCAVSASKLIAQRLYYLVKSIGHEAMIDISGSNYIITNHPPESETPFTVQKNIDLGEIPEDQFVFDIETSSGNFNGGIGQITLKNTDSCFFDFSQHWEKVLGLKLEGRDALVKSIELCQKAGKIVTAALKKPHDLEYEKTFFPFIQLAKKRYVGNLYEDDPDHFKQKSMGIVLKRRDNAPIVKDIYGGIVDIILNERDIKKAVKFFRESVRELLDGRADIGKLVITKTLRAEYKNPDSIAHKVLADRMMQRDPGNVIQSNERIPFVYIQTKAQKGEKLLQGDKVEHPDYIKSNPDKCKPDFLYYLDHQIKVPCIQLLSLALEQLDGYHVDWMDNSVINKMKEKGKTESDIKDKIMTLREEESEKLLLSDILRIYLNKQSGSSMITDFFKKRSGEIADFHADMFPKKKVTEPIGIEKIKQAVELKKETAEESEKGKIITVDKKDLARVAKIKADLKEEAKQKKTKSVPKSEETQSQTRKQTREEKVKLALGQARLA